MFKNMTAFYGVSGYKLTNKILVTNKKYFYSICRNSNRTSRNIRMKILLDNNNAKLENKVYKNVLLYGSLH